MWNSQFVSAGSVRFHSTVYFPLRYFAGQVPHSAADGDVICQNNRLRTGTPLWMFVVFFCFKLQENPENQDQQREFTEERFHSLAYSSSPAVLISQHQFTSFITRFGSLHKEIGIKMKCVSFWFWSAEAGERGSDNVSYSRWCVTLQSWQKLSEATERFCGCSHLVSTWSQEISCDINNTKLRTTYTWKQPASEWAPVIRHHLPALYAQT